MDLSNSVTLICQWLAQDVSLWGGLQSPLLSWLGSGAIILFFLWHAGMLLSGVFKTRVSFTRVSPPLTALAQYKKQFDEDWLVIRPPIGPSGTRPARPTHTQPDIDNAKRLDTLLQPDPLFQRSWLQFRKSLIVERVPWHIDPRIHSTRPAEEFFSQEALFHGRLNLEFYHQLPSLITGMGLLLTFMALLIGLSKLHADGPHILGIQGLINGLAGKFLTSIVGLICANTFVLIEKAVFFRLSTAHQEFLNVIDELFPRKTMEQMLEHQVFPSEQREERHLTANLVRVIQAGLEPSIKELNRSIHQLSRALGGIAPNDVQSETNLDHHVADETRTLHSLSLGKLERFGRSSSRARSAP